ncbi:unnamed protein product, partial [Symbiodinium pilosum]
EAIELWMELTDMNAEENSLGYPQWVLDEEWHALQKAMDEHVEDLAQEQEADEARYKTGPCAQRWNSQTTQASIAGLTPAVEMELQQLAPLSVAGGSPGVPHIPRPVPPHDTLAEFFASE